MTLLNDIRRGPHSWEGVNASPEWADHIRELKEEKNAIILAHNYQIPEIQDIADHTGDSLALSRIAADAEEDIIVFCGVHFMAETAKILSPDKKVLIPDAEAGCSLADSITADELRAWKAEYPDALVVSYVNTTAEVKALTDVCCTSSNAVDVVRHLPEDKEILFLPDQFLGAHVQRETGRDNIHVWAGECHVHAGINGKQLGDQAQEHPTSQLYIHPECGCANSAIYLAGEGAIDPDRVHMLSTGQMLGEATSLGEQNAGFAGSSSPSRTVLVATEIGMLHQLRKAAPGVDFLPVNEHASCPYMKMITPAALLRCLELEQDEVTVPADIADRARASVEAMISIGNPGGGE
ncbi:quinolinate synthase NadA [Corynebacterium falsenii]|uniref:quinolinate synthase NadA n=1 Tax=Corynebacterium falsenii TaxID=108486 RepID=UPI001D970F5F|nr:quinolinate synthase NadA [Corynebacterium falsenii]HJF13085.1 quinolinate synthase NadA [Corynebacterium falsenii]